MSKTLLIRHLSADLTVLEREDFLKHFGAEKVWFINSKSHSAFASFKTETAAKEALSRLHQLNLLGKRLTVEYAQEVNTNQSNLQTDNDKSIRVKKFIDELNSWNQSVDIFEPPPPNLRYKYPPPKGNILFNIIFNLHNNMNFYTQTLHLMNKFGLDPPFDDLKENVKSFILDCLTDVGIQLQQKEFAVKNISIEDTEMYSEESEISSNDDTSIVNSLPVDLYKKRKSSSKRINKIPRTSLQLKGLDKKNNKIYDTKEVFEKEDKHEMKKIELRVSKSLSIPNNENRIEVVGTIGKINPSKVENDLDSMDTSEKEVNDNCIDNSDVITIKELFENKISLKDMKSLPIYKNYHPGSASMRLYIKNLSKDATTQDVERIYRRYIVNCDKNQIAMFNVRVMQEGRMKGQAFVTLPTVELSEKALNETNGFILKSKPLVVQFARTAK